MRLLIFLYVCALSFAGFAQTNSKADSLERILPQLTDAQHAKALYDLSVIYSRSDYDKLNHVVQESRQFERDKNPLTRTYALLTLAIGNAMNGANDSALFRLGQAKEYALMSKDPEGLIRVCGTLGKFLIGEGKAEEGLKNLFQALKLLETNPLPEYEVKVRVNISYAYLELKRFRDCVDFGNSSLPLILEPSFQYIKSYIYNNSAVSYGALNMLDSAKYMVEKGIAVARANDDNENVANGYFILGTIYSNASQYPKAIEQYELAKPYRAKVGNPFFMAADLQALSDLYYKAGNFPEGVKAGEEALAIATKHNLLLKFENTYVGLAKNYRGLGEHQQASRYFELWAMAKDSIYKNSSAEAVAEMKTKYETEKKEQQIVLQKAQLNEQELTLQKTYLTIAVLVVLVALVAIVARERFRRKQLIADQEKELAVREAFVDATIQSQENERKRFAQDLHDGMGQLISSLRLMVNQLERPASLEQKISIAERSETILNDMHAEIRSIAFNLMPQTLIQHGLVPALREMAIRLNQTGKIAVTVTGYDIPERLQEAQEISLYRITQEWVNNVIKYSGATKVEIQLVGHEGEINITVEDNGAGFDTALLESGKGNGWKNIKSRVSLIRGELEVDSSPSRAGTSLMIRIPVIANEVSVTAKPKV